MSSHDSAVKRNIYLMIAGLFGLFVVLVVLARNIAL